METYSIYTDGGARGNPGPAGAGAVITDATGTTIAEVSEYLGERTNNWAEYQAAILALETLKKTIGEKRMKDAQIDVHLDSELVTKQLNGEYQVKEETLFPAFITLHNFRVKFPHITFTHVRREANRDADALANAAMDRAKSG